MKSPRPKAPPGAPHRAVPAIAARRGRALLAAGASALLAAAALAATAVESAHADPLVPGRSTIDGGGVSFASAGSFVLGGTIGQPDAGLLSVRGFEILGGFWSSGAGAAVSVEDDSLPPEAPPPPSVLRVYPAAPNPAFRGTQLRLDVPEPSAARVDVYDLNGALVRNLVKRDLPAGRTMLSWNARDDAGNRVAAGLYFVRIRIGSHHSTQKVVVVR